MPFVQYAYCEVEQLQAEHTSTRHVMSNRRREIDVLARQEVDWFELMQFLVKVVTVVT